MGRHSYPDGKHSQDPDSMSPDEPVAEESEASEPDFDLGTDRVTGGRAF